MCCGAFFRTAEVFAALKAWVVEDLLDRATPDNPARRISPYRSNFLGSR
jgi:hypothetical protein